MTRDNTRRAFLQRIGGVSVIGIPTYADGEDNDTTLTATDLLIPASEVPPGFESYPTKETNSFIDALHDSTVDVASIDIDVQVYWQGTTPSDPEWVLASTALIADSQLPRPRIEDAAQQSYDDYVEAYNAETGPMIDFEQAHSCDDEVSDWRVDIIERSLFNDSTERAEHILTDRMRHQFLGNVVLGTIAFGPADTDPPIDSLLEKYAALQRAQYDTHGATP